MLQSVLIPRYEERASPSAHTVYEVRVKANVRDWALWRRYSEFDDLHSALKDAVGEHPPAPLPPKHALSIFRSHSDPKLLEERRAGLETAKEDKWRETFVFREFLGIPIGKQGEFAAGWAHIDLQAQIRDVRADINKRDALSDRGDTNGAHTSNVAAKKKLAGGELQRRTDMIARLRDDCEKLGKMVTVARLTSRAGDSLSSRAPAPDTDREALDEWRRVDVQAVWPGLWRSGQTEGDRRDAASRTTTGCLCLQEQKMQQQDSEVSQLTAVLQRQRHLGEAISNELAVQIELLDDLANRVDETTGKLTHTNREMGRLR
ncbi:syntaxin [Mycena polygramma]|nr:syntaxin [Mycena polygramma]